MPTPLATCRATSPALACLLAILLNAALAPHVVTAVPPAQGPLVVTAVDNDPGNLLWNCDTNRVPFGNMEVDHSRCFSFHYSVPREGIKSATVQIALSTLGADQDTDATIVAVGKPYAPCAWGQGRMAGCVGVHGGFTGAHQSLNLDLMNIACDPSAQGTPEGQRLVLDQLQTGTLHMLLQDDTAVQSAALVLNGGPANFTCGASSAPISTAAANVSPSSGSSNTDGDGIGAAVNTLLTGAPSPRSPNRGAVAAAAALGVVALGAFVVVNSLLSRAASGGMASATTPAGAPGRVRITDSSARTAPSKPAALPEKQPPRSADTAQGAVRAALAEPGNLPEQEAGATQRFTESVAEARPGQAMETVAGSQTEPSSELEDKLREEAESKLQEGLDQVKDQIEKLAEPDSKWKCRQCGCKNLGDHRYCVKCGTPRGRGG